jgi:DNA-binding NtrC family response regulator
MEAFLIETALQRHAGNQAKAARELGINPSTLYRKLRAMGRRPPAP